MSKTKPKAAITRRMLKSKIHRATVTEANLAYEGSITIDSALLESADIIPFEEVSVYNVTNGERFSTYAIPGPTLGGDICINGAAAHKAGPGDIVIIASYVSADEDAVRDWQPKLVHVDEKNQQRHDLPNVERAEHNRALAI